VIDKQGTIVFNGFHMNHMDLLHQPEVYETIKQWLEKK